MNTLKKIYEDHIGISAVITVIVMMALLHFVRMVPLSYEMSFVVGEAIVAIVMMFIIYIINGEGKLLFSTKGLGYAFKIAWWPLLISLGLSILMIFGSISQGHSVADNPVLVILGAVVLSIFVGYFEEGLFRGVVLNAFLSKFGGNYKGILMSCIYSSIIFGFVHVYSDFFAFFYNPSTFSMSALGQVIGKTISAGLIGFVLAVIVLRTHNLFDVAVIHGINDLGPFLMTFLLNQTGLTNYVTSDGAQSSLVSIGYVIQFVLMLPAVIYAYRQLKKVSIPQWGMFKEPWYPHSVKKAK